MPDPQEPPQEEPEPTPEITWDQNEQDAKDYQDTLTTPDPDDR